MTARAPAGRGGEAVPARDPGCVTEMGLTSFLPGPRHRKCISAKLNSVFQVKFL